MKLLKSLIGASIAADGVTVSRATVVDARGLPVSSADSFVAPNRIGPARVHFGFRACQNGDLINISVTTPLGTVTSTDLVIP